MKSVFVVGPGNSDLDTKWGIWVTDEPVRNRKEALMVYGIDEGEEETAYYGKGKDEKLDKYRAVEKAKRVAKRVHARKRIVII